MTEFDELVGLLDDDDLATEEQSAQKKPRLKSPMSLFSHKKKEDDKETTPKRAKKSPMAVHEGQVSFGKKKPVDEAEEVSEAEEEPKKSLQGPLKAWRRASEAPTRRRRARLYRPRPSTSTKKSPPLPPRRPSSTKKTDVPASIVVEEDAPIPAAPASTPDGPRKSWRCWMMRATLTRRGTGEDAIGSARCLR